MCMCIYVCVCVYVYIYIYMFRERGAYITLMIMMVYKGHTERPHPPIIRLNKQKERTARKHTVVFLPSSKRRGDLSQRCP